MTTSPITNLAADLDAAITRAATEQPDEPWAQRWAEVTG